MGPGILWNLTEFARRLGAARTDFPPVAYNVQPVLNVGDGSALSTPIVPPSCLVGCQSSPTLNNFATTIVRSLAPGGTALIEMSATSGGGATLSPIVAYVEAIGAEPGTFTNVATAINQDIGPEPCKIVVLSGYDTVTAAAEDQHPSQIEGFGSVASFGSELYLPPGKQLRLAVADADKVLRMTMLVQEWHSAVPSS